ncbi:hypothetical protein FA15DRAFT_645949 [Coprinopsis marcescibilis]|uniref:Uncharacterized protein n=1 Tax=Coprinopsis marcescibilis TaxID=230819 RepID=A0A5C3KLW7_COPMA|nr:hypothetical protein FA15DRAFT_645949 [Coprinopsis marcescibilis]
MLSRLSVRYASTQTDPRLLSRITDDILNILTQPPPLPEQKLSPQQAQANHENTNLALRNNSGISYHLSSTQRKDGFTPVSHLLRHPLLSHIDFKTLEEVVYTTSSKYFELRFRPLSWHGSSGMLENWWIRVQQGHTNMPANSIRRVLSPKEIRKTVHATTAEAWESIKTQGLSRLDGDYIHMYQGVPGVEAIRQQGMKTGISHPRNKVLIFVNAGQAIQEGIKFYRSWDGLILTPGNADGVIPPKMLKRVERIQITRKKLSLTDEVEEENTAEANDRDVVEEKEDTVQKK